MRLGIFGARADSRGLAYQTQAYAKWLQPHAVYGLDLTADELSPYECDWQPFWDCPELTINRYSGLTEDSIRRWLKSVDVVFGAETFYHPEFLNIAKQEGVKTVLHINPEFWNHKTDQHPDVIVNPTIWRRDYLPGVAHLPMPVDREVFPFRLRTQAKKFVHIGGHAAAADRAGTRIVLGAGARLRDYDIIIRSQSPLKLESPFRPKLESGGITKPQDLYSDADVIIQPRRYGGNNLVANEALSSGCPMIVLNREPESTWDGVVTLATRTRGNLRTKAGLIPLYDALPHSLSQTVKRLRDRPTEVEMLSRRADAYAETISWERLLPRYMDVLGC